MSLEKAPPVIYLLYGDDDLAIAQFVADLKAKLGDPSLAEMNVVRLDGRTLSYDDLVMATSVTPFLAPRRLVLLSHPLARMNNEALRQKFLNYFERIPSTTALLLIVDHLLTGDKERAKGHLHWLEKWALERKEKVFVRSFVSPKGHALSNWIQNRAKNLGGRFTLPAAELLASLVGDEIRSVDQEILKLLTYVNYDRPVDADDVSLLTVLSVDEDVFDLVDALGHRDGSRAVGILGRLLAEKDEAMIFGMIIRQFRLLLLTREILDAHGMENDICHRLGVVPFIANKITRQARKFNISQLEDVFRRLLDIDLATKTSQFDPEINLGILIAEVTM